MNHPFAVDISELHKVFYTSFFRRKTYAVRGVSFQVSEGEVYGLIGPNGSGKSTTMKALLGLLIPTSGACRVFGQGALKVDVRASVGYLPESPYFHKHLTGEETLLFYGKLCGIRGGALLQRVEELLLLVGLGSARGQKVGAYSKGMLQRLGLAQALIHDPKLLILDEPTAGVDPAGVRFIQDLILELKARGNTVILCSHLLTQVQSICDRIAIMMNGKIVMEGGLEELLTVQDSLVLEVRGAEEARAALVKGVRLDETLELVSEGKPKLSLESLFLDLAQKK